MLSPLARWRSAGLPTDHFERARIRYWRQHSVGIRRVRGRADRARAAFDNRWIPRNLPVEPLTAMGFCRLLRRRPSHRVSADPAPARCPLSCNAALCGRDPASIRQIDQRHAALHDLCVYAMQGSADKAPGVRKNTGGAMSDMTSGRDRPWIFRTYAGHSTATESNKLYRSNLAKGQTGLSIAFDLPTQTGYDPDHALSKGEVGKVGVPIAHLGDMRGLFEEIPLERMNTSMTINATAPWLLALYAAAADEQGADRKLLAGTTQNDIVKEYLSRGTYVFPPQPSMKPDHRRHRLDLSGNAEMEPDECLLLPSSGGRRDAGPRTGFRPVDRHCRSRHGQGIGRDHRGRFPQGVAGRISFFVNAGMRFITEMCKMRAFVDLWDEITRERYGIEDEKYRRFRYGVQVNSLGLTEQQPENNVYRILVRNARRRSFEESAGPRRAAAGVERGARPAPPMGSAMVDPHAADHGLRDRSFGICRHFRRQPRDRRQGRGVERRRSRRTCPHRGDGRCRCRDRNQLHEATALSRANTARLATTLKKGESGGRRGQCLSGPRPRHHPCRAGDDARSRRLPAAVECGRNWRSLSGVARGSGMHQRLPRRRLSDLEAAAKEGRNVMEPSIACAKAGVTTGEWGAALALEVFGEYRAPTGVGQASRASEAKTNSSSKFAARLKHFSANGMAAAFEVPGRQARPGWSFERRRANCCARPRLRHGSGL